MISKASSDVRSAAGIDSHESLEELKRAEAAFFDASATARSQGRRIPFTADIRCATRVVGRPGVEPVDAKIYEIQQGAFRNRYLDLVAHRPGGRVLDICCGPDWLALELGRCGQSVDAYDISPVAIDLAKQTLAENPYTDGFGEVRYHLQDVSQVDLGVEQYDAVSGWSAFHHLPDFHEFMERVYRALKPGGIVATMDDYPRRSLEINIQRAFGLLLPTTDRSYSDKFRAVVNRLRGRTKDEEEIFSPMEQAKYSTVSDIQHVWRSRFDLLEDIPFNAFAISPMLLFAGPDWFRYGAAHLVDMVDKLGCAAGILKPNNRILIARKPG